MSHEMLLPGRVPAALATVALALGGNAAKQAIEPVSALADQNCVTEKYDAQVIDPITGNTITVPAERITCKDGSTDAGTPQPDTASPQPPTTETSPTPELSKPPHRRTQSTGRLPHAFVDYNQNHNNFKWGKGIAKTGCGPTVLAMVMATLTGNKDITPNTIANRIRPMKLWAPGNGMSEKAFAIVARHYGIKERSAASLSDAKKVAKLGGLSIIHAKPGHFTGLGHYMVIKGVKNGNFLLADPNNKPGRDSETKAWSAGKLRAYGVDGVWTFSPKTS
jgi:hypothetical protein